MMNFRIISILAGTMIIASPLFAQDKYLEVKDLFNKEFRVGVLADAYHWEGKELKKGREKGASAPSAEPIIEKLDEVRDGIVVGESVSRNEFGIEKGLFPSNDGKKIAFYLKDEMDVTKFPLLDISTRTGSLKEIRYPMNGMTSEKISLGIYDKETGAISWLRTKDFETDSYLTCITWSPDDRYIFIQELDRAQHNMHLNQYDVRSGEKVRTILKEKNNAWVEPSDPLYFIKGSYDFLYRTDNRDGFKSLYLCDTLGIKRRITEVNADVAYLANDGKYVYYTSAEISPVENHLFRVDISKKVLKPQRLTFEEGWHDITMKDDCSQFVDSWSSYYVPRITTLCKSNGKVIDTLEKHSDPLEGYKKVEVEFGAVRSAKGSKFMNNYRLYKPADFDSTKKYPLILYVYGGPHSQMVQNRWMGNIRMWEYLMAQKGYVVYVQDNRGTLNHGAEYEKAINKECGQNEMRDQMVGIYHLMERPWIDRDRIGVHGWSYGGFMTISLMTNYPNIFKVGIAGGPVIDWRWYEVMYGERYMDTEATNPVGFAKTSLMNQTKNLKGKLLILQGAVDETVVWQHSLSFVQKCIEDNVQLDYFPYPCTKHNVTGEWRAHLYQKITDYFVNEL